MAADVGYTRRQSATEQTQNNLELKSTQRVKTSIKAHPSEYQLSVEMPTLLINKICGQWFMPSQSIAQSVGLRQQQHTANEVIQQSWYVIGSSKWYNQEKDKTPDAKNCFGFNIPLDTKYVISQMLFPANLLTSTEKTKSKPECGPMPNMTAALGI